MPSKLLFSLQFYFMPIKNIKCQKVRSITLYCITNFKAYLTSHSLVKMLVIGVKVIVQWAIVHAL